MNTHFDFQRAVHLATSGLIVATRQLVGDANETHAVELNDGQHLVIRILRFSGPERARQEVPVQHALTAAGIVAPISLDLKNGDVVGRVCGLDFTVSRFIEGQHPTTITEGLEAGFGRILAGFHRATHDLTVEGTGWMNPLALAEAVQAVRDIDFRRGLEDIQRTTHQVFDADLPQANIHGDVWPGNVFAEGDNVTAVLDLETVEPAPRIIDIGRTAVALVAESTRSPDDVLRAIASAYSAVEPLSRGEEGLLPMAYRLAMVASAAWNIENGHPEHARAMFSRAQGLSA